jgi:ATP-dependent Lon protease
VLIPKDNEKDLVEIPAEVREKVTFIPVANVADVMRNALEPAKKRAGFKKQPKKRAKS